MKRKSLSLLIIILALCASMLTLTACNQEPFNPTPSEGLEYQLINDGTEYEVTGIGTCTDLDIVIPSTYNGKPVTSIDFMAFYACNLLTSVVLPNSVQNIDPFVFFGCSSLTNIKLPNGLTSISDFMFGYCTSLKNIEIPNGVTSIGDAAFEYCTSLNSVMIGKGVTHMGQYAFSGCTALEKVYYKGTASDWMTISLDVSASLADKTIYYYVENEADLPSDGGNYWHYDNKGNVVIW